MKRCYYQILGVDPKCTPGQIKSSYRKLALKYHPDKNPSEEAKQLFVELTDAYNVLSDPNERTWYDNNREKILFNKEDMSKEDLEQYSFGFNIWEFFTTQCFKDYGDEKGEFYEVYRSVFEKIKGEEAKAYHARENFEETQLGELRKYQGFGDSNTIIEKVLRFYEDWQNFTTYKTFVWVDDWDTREAPNRYVKREMEKQNKKQRIKQKKNYIKTIKDLTSYVKKRDPRIRDYLIKQKQEEQEKQKQRKQRQEEKKKQKEEMKKMAAQIQQQRFREVEEYFKQQNPNSTVNNDEDQYGEEEIDYEFYCQVCAKQFKSENQLKNHEKSKVHKQNVKAIQKEVMMKEEVLEEVKKKIDEQQVEAKNVSSEPSKKKKKKNRKKNKGLDELSDEIQEKVQAEIQEQPVKQKESKTESTKPQKNNKGNNKGNKKKEASSDSQEQQRQNQQKEAAKKKPIPDSESESSDDPDAFISAFGANKGSRANTKIEEKLDKNDIDSNSKKNKKQKNKKKDQPLVVEQSSDSENEEQAKKKGKAKLKRQKKAAKEKETGHKCNVCSESFPSKTKLFDHIKKSGHAKAI